MIDCGLPILKKYLKKCIRDSWKKNNLFISLIISKIKLKLFLTFETVVDVCCSTIDLKKKFVVLCIKILCEKFDWHYFKSKKNIRNFEDKNSFTLQF